MRSSGGWERIPKPNTQPLAYDTKKKEESDLLPTRSSNFSFARWPRRSWLSLLPENSATCWARTFGACAERAAMGSLGRTRCCFKFLVNKCSSIGRGISGLVTLTNEDLAVRDQLNVRELMVECMWDQLLQQLMPMQEPRRSNLTMNQQRTWQYKRKENNESRLNKKKRK